MKTLYVKIRLEDSGPCPTCGNEEIRVHEYMDRWFTNMKEAKRIMNALLDQLIDADDNTR